MGFLKRVVANLALILGGIVVALLVAEAGLRIVNHWFPYFFCYDAERGWALRPGASGFYDREGEAWVQINRRGFRGPGRLLRKPRDTFRVAVLGDSYAEAIQVPYDQTFSAVMERRLAQCPALKGKRIEVLDFGVDGYGTAQELLTLRNQALAYSPDAVVLAVFLGNDIRNNSAALEGDRCRPFYALRDGKLVSAGPLLDSAPFRLWCMARFNYRDFSIPALIANAWTIIKQRHRGPPPRYPVERAINYNIYKPPPDAAWRDAWRVTEVLITAVRDEAVRHNALFMAVTLDAGIQVWPNPQVRRRFMRWQGIKGLFYPEEQIAALGKREGFTVLTLAPQLQKYAEAHNVYLHGFKNTPMGFGHWNAEGHRKAGELMAEKLCNLLAHRAGR